MCMAKKDLGLQRFEIMMLDCYCCLLLIIEISQFGANWDHNKDWMDWETGNGTNTPYVVEPIRYKIVLLLLQILTIFLILLPLILIFLIPS